MRITQVLFKQRIKRMIQKHWYIQGNVKVIPTTTEAMLKSRGMEVVDAVKYLFAFPKKEKVKCIGYYDKEPLRNHNHPDYKCEPCFIVKDNDLLLEGLEQAKVLTNTVEITQELPELLLEKEKKLDLPEEAHLEIQRKIKLCCMFEAMQEKLPKRIDPLRPNWRFSREYGILESKRNELLCKNLITVCELLSRDVKNKSMVLDAFFSSPFEAHNKKIQFEVSSELLITKNNKIKLVAEPNSTCGFDLPKLFPMDCTASINGYNFYSMKNIYPLNSNSKWPYIQTAIVHLNHSQVKNIIEEEVTESQIQGRSLVKGFCMAAAEARAIYGSDVRTLPEPIVVPVIQTDGKVFYFSVFQLNTLDLDKNSEVKNIFWYSQSVPLYLKCEYVKGRPVLEGYNPDVIRKLLTFYNLE